MTPTDLSHHRIQDVQNAMADYVPQQPEVEPRVLEGLCRAVLTSIDVRDLGDVDTPSFIRQSEELLTVAGSRNSGEIHARAMMQGDQAVVVACLDDQPFLVSSMRALFKSEGLEVRSAINAIIHCQRDRDGRLTGFGGDRAESMMRFELRIPPGTSAEHLEQKVRERLTLARVMVRDFGAMRDLIGQAAKGVAKSAAVATPEEASQLNETEALLLWLCDENFVIFSVEEYSDQAELQSSLGISTVNGQSETRAAVIKPMAGQPTLRPVRYFRSLEESPVHRSGKPGFFVFVIPKMDQSVDRFCVVEGLFTYKALHTPPEMVPHLRVSLRDLISSRGVSAESHRGKSITNAFNSLPLEFLVSEAREHAWEVTDRVLRAEAKGESDVYINISEDRRFAFVFVALPRWQFSAELRLEIQRVLQQRFEASYSDYGVYMDRDENAILHFYISGVRPLPQVDVDSLREEVLPHAKGWNERLKEAIDEAAQASDDKDELFSDYLEAFSEEHMRRAGGERLASDIRCLQRLREGQTIDSDLFVSRTSDHPGSLNLRVFTREPLSLSRQLPVLAAFGFEVIDEYTREIRLPHMSPIGTHTFRLNVRPARHKLLLARSDAMRETMVQVFSGNLEHDSLNRLIISAEMSASEVQALRAYLSYIHQLQAPYSLELMREVLGEHASVAQSLLHLLVARFGPEPSKRSDAELEESLRSELSSVRDYTADRVLRAIADVVRATVRTNAFSPQRAPSEAIAIKLDGSAVPFGPQPRPFREIWVYHPDFRGVHLRGGKVARGGLRFSDRPEDFRTEIHDLMATQMVKNVVIVPMGAKGGFVLTQAPSDRAELRRAGDSTYPKFISALLSVTDNVVEGEIVTPPGIRHQEEPDPYFVVAADKGTAHLSDVANGLSQERNFWLDDAFASGGSNGYDHKATGITARGAWEVAKRNFRELGIDPESDVITAIGVGDMSGDVFGNGLLRSKTVKLKAAFNHMHVFIDPDPDCAASYEERLRLFKTPRSQWSDYSAEVLSKGGGVYSRYDKAVELSPEARAMLGIEEGVSLSGEALIREVMKMRVDLFWMGGIGTYVKASDESHADVGDKNNDSVRVNANQLNCRIFAEGANLSITERGRVELAKRGAFNYTASLDNSGGVDASDHEVNLKILFAPLLFAKTVSRDERNRLLEAVEDEVCEMVLDNNRSQSRMASFDMTRSRSDAWRYWRTQQRFVEVLDFDPDAFALPQSDEFARRANNAEGLFRCETAVLGLHAKMFAYGELLEAEPLPEDLLQGMVRRYFPPSVLKVAGEAALEQHLLRRELGTTMVVNRIVDNMGASFFPELISASGGRVLDIVKAYDLLDRSFHLEALYGQLFALEDKHRQLGIYQAMRYIADSVEAATFYLLGPTGRGIEEVVLAQGPDLLTKVDALLTGEVREHFDSRIQELVAAQIPDAIARGIARLDHLTVVLDAFALSQNSPAGPEDLLKLRLNVAQSMHLTRLINASVGHTYVSPWDGAAAMAICRQLEVYIHRMTRLVEGGDVEAMIEKYNLRGVREQIQHHLQSDVTVAELVMINLHLRRLLPQA